MDLRRITDWTTLPGADIELQQLGEVICTGRVDAVTADGSMLWIQAPGQTRKLYAKKELFEAWAREDRMGFHYQISSRQPIGDSVASRALKSA